MARTSDTGVVDSPTRRNFQDVVMVEAPNLTQGGRRTKFGAAVDKAGKASPGVARKKPSVAQKRDPQDQTRIILSYARQIGNDARPADEQAFHSSLNSGSPKICRDNFQRVVRSTTKYLTQTQIVSGLKEAMFEGQFAFAATLGALLQEDSSADKLKTTLESLATEVQPYTEVTAAKFWAMSAKLDEIKKMQDQCSSLIDRVRPISGTVTEAYAKQAKDPECTQALEAELEASEVTLSELSLHLRSLESEYDCFRKTFMSFNPTLLPVCKAGHTMALKQVPKDQTVFCEQCHTPSRSQLSKDQDLVATKNIETSCELNFKAMWHCAAPSCNEDLSLYLCSPCGRVRGNPGDRWLSCLSMSSEWEDVKKDAYCAVEQTTAALQIARWREQETHEEENCDQSVPSGPVCEEGEQQNPDCLLERTEASEPPKTSTHPNHPVCVGLSASFFQWSATPQPATESSPKTGRRSALGHRPASASALGQRPASASALGHRPASASRWYRLDSNLAALPGFVVTSTAVAFTEKAQRCSGAVSLSDQELLKEEVDAQNKHSPSRRSSRPKSHGSQREPKEPDSPSTRRRSAVYQHLPRARASTPNGQPSPIFRRAGRAKTLKSLLASG